MGVCIVYIDLRVYNATESNATPRKSDIDDIGQDAIHTSSDVLIKIHGKMQSSLKLARLTKSKLIRRNELDETHK